MTTLTLKPGILLQSTFSKTGYGQHYDEIDITKGNYTARIPLKLNSGTTITGDENAIINLIPQAPISTFPSMTPIFGQAEDTIKDITIENIQFNGNAAKQIVAHGRGYHNFLGLSNAENINIRNVTAFDTQGDIARITDSKNIRFFKNTVIGAGHDGLFVDRCSEVSAWNNVIYLRTNSALRCKGSKNVKFRNNKIYRTDEYVAYSPGIIAEVSKPNETSSNIEIYENYIEGTYGPAIWAAGFSNEDPNAASGLTIRNNLIVNCGQMPKEATISGVGGIVVDGWNNIKILNNTIDSSFGYGILIGSYIGKSSGNNYTAEIKHNIISNTVQSLYKGTGSGSGVMNLIPDRYTIDEAENCYYNNLQDYYNAKITDGMTKNPLFVGNGDYHLQSQSGHFTENGYVLDEQTSPCIFPKLEWGRYGNTEEGSHYHVTETNLSPGEIIGDSPAVIILCSSENEAMKLSEALVESGYLGEDQNAIVYVPKSS